MTHSRPRSLDLALRHSIIALALQRSTLLRLTLSGGDRSLPNRSLRDLLIKLLAY